VHARWGRGADGRATKALGRRCWEVRVRVRVGGFVHARRAAGWKYRGNGVRIAGSGVEVVRFGGGNSTAQHNTAMQRRDDDVRVKFPSFFKGCCYLRGPSIGTAFGSVYYTHTPGYHALSETPVLLKETPRFHANYDNRLTINACSCRRIEET
jgi:hypothetical protein